MYYNEDFVIDRLAANAFLQVFGAIESGYNAASYRIAGFPFEGIN